MTNHRRLIIKIFNKKNHRWLYCLLILVTGLLAYSVLLTIGIPGKIVQIVQAEDFTALFIACLLLFYFAYRPSGWLGTLTSFSSTLIVFALPLAALWRSGLSESGYVMAGLLTMTDTDAYYTSALRLLEGDTFTPMGSWRPLSHGVLATLLGFTQQNLQLTLAILVLITAIACFLLAREVQRSHGTGAGVLLLTAVFVFYRKYIGTASTENLGLALGASGLAILWRGAVHKRLNLCLLGIFLLTLGLNARAGAMFVLPAVVLWGTWSFRGSSRFSAPFLLGGVSVVLLGFILNSLVVKVIGFPDVMAYSNFSYSLYGLITGGNWQTVINKYPELGNFNDPEASRKIYALTLEVLRANPFALVKGCIRAWQQFLLDDFVFSFVRSAKVNVTLQILSLITLINCYRQRQNSVNLLLILANLGILLSIPFVPPWDAGTRVYAATIPVISLLPALGLTFIAQKMEWRKLLQMPLQKEQRSLVWICGLNLALLTIGGPIGTKIMSHTPQYAEISCPIGTEVAYFRHGVGSSLNLVSDNGIKRTYVPNIRISDFRKILEKYQNKYAHHPEIPALAQELSRLTPNTTLIRKLNLKTGKTIWVIADSQLVPQETGIVGTCGKPSVNSSANGYLRFLFYADSMTLVSRNRPRDLRDYR